MVSLTVGGSAQNRGWDGKGLPTPARLTLAVAASVLAAEVVADFLYLELAPGSFWFNCVVDPCLTVLLTFPALYLLTFRPMTRHLEEIHRVNAVLEQKLADLKRAEEALGVSRQQLRALAARIEAVREEERTRLAREIHDVLAQDLTLLKLDLAWVDRRLAQPQGDISQAPLREKLGDMTRLADKAIQSVQRIATELRPAVLDSLGLAAAIEWQMNDFGARCAFRCETRLPDKPFELDRERSTALFRILQESLTNVARHAAATAVETSLQWQPDEIVLRVKDNGRGIPTGKLEDPRSVGLAGMRERALFLGGHCEISACSGEGTTVEVRLPLPFTDATGDKP